MLPLTIETPLTASPDPLSVAAKSDVDGEPASGSLYVTSSVVPDAVRDVTAGAEVSMTMFFWPPRLDAPPTVGRVSVASFPAASRIVPPFSAREATVA